MGLTRDFTANFGETVSDTEAGLTCVKPVYMIGGTCPAMRDLVFEKESTQSRSNIKEYFKESRLATFLGHLLRKRTVS